MPRSTSRSRRPFRLRPLLWRWHRRAGLAAALVLLMVAISGVLLNHTAELNLARQPVRSAWLLSLYGMEAPVLQHFSIGDTWISGDSREYFYLGDQQVGYCGGGLVGAVAIGEMLVAGCRQALTLLNREGEILERLGEGYGLPLPVERIGRCQSRLCVEAGTQTFQVDLMQLSWQVWPGAVEWSVAESVPEPRRARILESAMGTELSLERVLLDLHSGRLGGRLGVLLVDMSALAMLFLSGSGFWLWWQQRRMARRRL